MVVWAFVHLSAKVKSVRGGECVHQVKRRVYLLKITDYTIYLFLKTLFSLPGARRFAPNACADDKSITCLNSRTSRAFLCELVDYVVPG